MTTANSIRVGCVGAGYIADTHASILRGLHGVALIAVVDPVKERAQTFARKWAVEHTYTSVDDLLSAKTVDVAHVLVPPMLHKSVAEQLLTAGIHVLLEKPMAQNTEECAALQKLAAASNTLLGVNQNALFHPAHRALRRLVDANRIGPLRHVHLQFNLPLRQLAARRLDHWMFDAPVNLLLEQAVHPLSQIDDLLGSSHQVVALTPPPLHLNEGQDIIRTWLVSLNCEKGDAQLLISLGESFPSWSATVIGDDGVIHVDYANNRIAYEAPSRRMEPFNTFSIGARVGMALTRQAFGNFVSSAASMARIGPRSDPFYLSMRGSLQKFYGDLKSQKGDSGEGLGQRLVALCEQIARSAGHGKSRQPGLPMRAARSRPSPDVFVIGGTGFIGSRVVARLIAEGRNVGVLARNIANLPNFFSDPCVQVCRGDARKREDLVAAIAGAPVVIDLAHGGGGASRSEVEANIVGSASAVGEACLALGVHRLIFVSSIAALYLGDPTEVVTGETPVDPFAEARADYARAKALAELALLELRRTRELPVTILRPGLVIGAGGTPFHSGVGFFNQETHCLGWNRGLNSLPLVLVEEVADAIIRAIAAPAIDGKCYNIVSDVRLTASDYIAELASATGRPLVYHPQSIIKLYLVEMTKALIKRLSGRGEPWPSLRDLKSRGLMARFDCTDAICDLGWHPVSDQEQFVRQGFAVHVSNR